MTNHPNITSNKDVTYATAQISVADILLVITQELKLIIATVVSFLGMVTFYIIFLSEPVYISYSTILPTGKSDDYAAAKGVASQLGVSLPGTDSKIDITSREMLLELLRSNMLAHQVLGGKVSIGDSNRIFNFRDILFEGTANNHPNEFYLEKGREMIRDLMVVSTDDKSPVIKIAVSTFDPH